MLSYDHGRKITANRRCLLIGFLFLFSWTFYKQAFAAPEFNRIYSLGKQAETPPNSPLVHDLEGNHYGTADHGGAYGFGYVFRLDANGSYSILYSFDGLNGKPSGFPLLQGSNGKFYGRTTSTGPQNDAFSSNAVVYELDTRGNAPVFTILMKDLYVENYVDTYITGLTLGQDNKLYGAKANGVIFTIDPTQAGTPYKSITPTLVASA